MARKCFVDSVSVVDTNSNTAATMETETAKKEDDSDSAYQSVFNRLGWCAIISAKQKEKQTNKKERETAIATTVEYLHEVFFFFFGLPGFNRGNVEKHNAVGQYMCMC